MDTLRTRAILFLTLVTMWLGASSADAEIPWQRSPEQVFHAARASGKPILVFVTADWCHYCKKMKQETWSDPEIASAVSQNFETLVLDGDDDRQVVKKLELKGFPATLIYNADGEFVAQRGGFMPPNKTIDWLRSTMEH